MTYWNRLRIRIGLLRDNPTTMRNLSWWMLQSKSRTRVTKMETIYTTTRTRPGQDKKNLSHLSQRPGSIQVLELRQGAANHLLCRAKNMLPSTLVLRKGCSVPHVDWGGEDGEVHHHSLWHIELLQLSQEMHPLLGSWSEGDDVQLSFEVLGEVTTLKLN